MLKTSITFLALLYVGLAFLQLPTESKTQSNFSSLLIDDKCQIDWTSGNGMHTCFTLFRCQKDSILDNTQKIFFQDSPYQLMLSLPAHSVTLEGKNFEALDELTAVKYQYFDFEFVLTCDPGVNYEAGDVLYKSDKKQGTARILDTTTTSSKTTQIQAYLDSETCTVFNILGWIYVGVVLLSILNSFAGISIHGIFFLISFAQSNNILVFINYVFPKNFVCFYQALGIFNFQRSLNLPSWVRSWFSDEAYVSQDPSEIFVAYGWTANWFSMGGKALTPLILMALVWVLVRVLRLARLGTEAFPILMKQIEEKIVWNGFIRMMQILYLPMLLSSLLQFQNVSFTTTTNVLGFLFALFCIILLVVFVLLSIIIGRSTELKDKGYQESYGAAFTDYWLDKEIDYFTANFELFIIVKKSIQVAGIIILGVLPSLQITFFVGTECVHTLFLFTKRRLRDKTNNKLASMMSVVHFFNTLILGGVFLIGEDGEGAGGAWVMVALSCILFLINLLLVLGEQLVSFEELFKFYGDFLYGIWLVFVAIFSCICCPCFCGFRFYQNKKSQNQSKASELGLL